MHQGLKAKGKSEACSWAGSSVALFCGVTITTYSQSQEVSRNKHFTIALYAGYKPINTLSCFCLTISRRRGRQPDVIRCSLKKILTVIDQGKKIVVVKSHDIIFNELNLQVDVKQGFLKDHVSSGFQRVIKRQLMYCHFSFLRRYTEKPKNWVVKDFFS